jgi:hypothetical protein
MRNSNVPAPELMHYRTGQADPAFVLVKLPLIPIEAGDWIGIMDETSGLCYGAKEVKDATKNTYIVCYGDEAMTANKQDGFAYGAAMKPFFWQKNTGRFFEITGDWKDERTGRLIQLQWRPLALFNVDNIAIGNEIHLATDPDLTNPDVAEPVEIAIEPETTTIFWDENVTLWVKNDEIWLKVLAEKMSLFLYRNDGGTEKRMFSMGSKVAGYNQKIVSNYKRSWKGAQIRIQYYHYQNGKMVSKTPTEKSFTF